MWLNGALHFSTGATEQSFVNPSTNTNVILTTGDTTWNVGLDIVVEGLANRTSDEPTLERLAALWITKWDGRWKFEALDGALHSDGGSEAIVFTVKPTKILAFGKGTFTRTR